MGLQNYVAVVTDELFTKALVNTALFTIGSIVGQFVIGMLLALFFHKNFPLNVLLRCCRCRLPAPIGSAAWPSSNRTAAFSTSRWLGIIDAPIPWLTSPDVALIAIILVNIWLGIPFNLTLLYSGPGHPRGPVRGGCAGRRDRMESSGRSPGPTCTPWSRLMLGVIYTLKVLDIILGLTQGGPADRPSPRSPTSARSWSSSSARAQP